MRQEKIQDILMSNLSDTSSCAHDGDLVAFLYGEANEIESLAFQTHLVGCSACRAEVSAFADVRGGIGEWRDEALHPRSAFAPDVIRQRVIEHAVSKRSALFALREFFTLSPMWLRGATAFAAVLFVALLLLTTFRYFDRSETQVTQQTSSKPSVVVEKSTTLQPSKDEPVASPASNASKRDLPSQKRQTTRVEIRNSAVVKANRRVNAPVLSNEERNQLSELLIAANEEEENVPRLYDLLTESN